MGIDYVYMDEFIDFLDEITDQKSIHIQEDFWEII